MVSLLRQVALAAALLACAACGRIEIGPTAEHSHTITLIGFDERGGALFTASAPGDLDQSEVRPQSIAACQAGGGSKCGHADACAYKGYAAVAVGTQLFTRVGVACGFETPALANQAALAKCGAPVGLLAKDCEVKKVWQQ
jgi:hypothetical protein